MLNKRELMHLFPSPIPLTHSNRGNERFTAAKVPVFQQALGMWCGKWIREGGGWSLGTQGEVCRHPDGRWRDGNSRFLAVGFRKYFRDILSRT